MIHALGPLRSINRVFTAVDVLPGREQSIAMNRADEIIAAFSQRVRYLREKSGVSQERFAIDAGLDRSYYSKIERGVANPTLRQIALIAEGLELPVEKLFKPPSSRNVVKKK
jgi:DNA-binding XRE family transcriptional regulator